VIRLTSPHLPYLGQAATGCAMAFIKLCLLEVEGLVLLKPFFLVIYGQISEVQALKM